MRDIYLQVLHYLWISLDIFHSLLQQHHILAQYPISYLSLEKLLHFLIFKVYYRFLPLFHPDLAPSRDFSVFVVEALILENPELIVKHD